MFIGFLRICTIESFNGSLGCDKGNIKCVSLNDHPCQTRPNIVNIRSDENLFYPFTVSVDKFGGICNTIDDPYAQVRVPNKVKYMSL